MRKIAVSELKAGYVLEGDIKSIEGKVLLRKGATLTEHLIERLKHWNAETEFVILADDNIGVSKNSKELENKIEKSLKLIFRASLGSLDAALSELEKYLSHIYGDLMSIEDLPGDVVKIRFANNKGGHYFRVSKMSAALASLYNRGVSEDKQIPLSSITLAALLHDYGKKFKNDSKALNNLKVSKFDTEAGELLDVPYVDDQSSFSYRIKLKDVIGGKYNERYNSAYAYVALKGKVPEDVRTTILYSKYTKEPLERNKKYGVSVQAAKIIEICDLYDTLLEYVVKQNMDSPFENVISYMSQLAHNNGLDKELYNLFVSHIPIYPTGTKVLLSNGEYAVVVRRSSIYPTKPLVLTLPPSIPDLIDLSEVTNITIKNIVQTEDDASLKIDAIEKGQLDEAAKNSGENIIPDGDTPETLILKKGETDSNAILGKKSR